MNGRSMPKIIAKCGPYKEEGLSCGLQMAENDVESGFWWLRLMLSKRKMYRLYVPAGQDLDDVSFGKKGAK